MESKMANKRCLVAIENIPRINLLLNIFQVSIISICNNRMALLFEGVQIIYHFTINRNTKDIRVSPV